MNENHSVATRFSLPIGGAIELGSTAKFCSHRKRAVKPSVARIAFSGAAMRSFTSRTHSGSWR